MTGLSPGFDLQGHRGARGLKPENTLPAFEVALDAGASSVETDVHLTRDGVPILVHDPWVHEKIFRQVGRVVSGGVVSDKEGSTTQHSATHHSPTPLATCPTGSMVRSLTLSEMGCYRADLNPDPARFPHQDAAVTPLARLFAQERGLDAFTPPTLADLIDFVFAYAGSPGEKAGKTFQQREGARSFRLDLELKRVPFRPELIGDDWVPGTAGLLERRVVDELRRGGMVERTTVRSFDHRSVRALKQLEPALTTAVLVSGTAPVDPGVLAEAAGASVYCPDFAFLDLVQVRQAHAHGLRVLPWTVNDPQDWKTLLSWGVDGITTDYPDRLAEFLRG